MNSDAAEIELWAAPPGLQEMSAHAPPGLQEMPAQGYTKQDAIPSWAHSRAVSAARSVAKQWQQNVAESYRFAGDPYAADNSQVQMQRATLDAYVQGFIEAGTMQQDSLWFADAPMQIAADNISKSGYSAVSDMVPASSEWCAPAAPGHWGDTKAYPTSIAAQRYADTENADAESSIIKKIQSSSIGDTSERLSSGSGDIPHLGAENPLSYVGLLGSQKRYSKGSGRSWSKGASHKGAGPEQYKGQRKDQIEAPERSEAVTTMMIRNIPKRYVNQMLAQELNVLGFKGKFDFLYIPIDPTTGWNVGYGFANFIGPKEAADCAKTLTGSRFCRCKEEQRKPIDVVPAHLQGLRKNLEHYCRTAVQFKSYRPMIIPEAFAHIPMEERVELFCEFGHLFQQVSAYGTKPSALHSHNSIPKHTDFQESSSKAPEDGAITTLMIRNIPKSFSNQHMVKKLNELGLKKKFDFVYVPIDQSTSFNVGYGFVNFVSPEAATECVALMKGLRSNKSNGSQHRKYIDVIPAHMQGLQKNLDYYRCTAVQFNNVQSHRPLINAEGLEHLTEEETTYLLNRFGHLVTEPSDM